MAAAVRDSIRLNASGSTITVNPATLTYQSGDVLVLFVWGYATVGTPSGSDLTWTQRATDDQVDTFATNATGRIYTAVADASITSFTLSNGIADQNAFILISVSGADTAAPSDGAAATSNSVGEPTAPSVSPAGADSLLLCGAYSMPSAGGGTFLPPSGMAELEDGTDFYTCTAAALALVASGATGTKAFDYSGTNMPWIALSIAVKSAPSGGLLLLRRRNALK